MRKFRCWWHNRRTTPEAEQARKRAEADLSATLAETPRFRDLSESLREIRERNHFAEAITASFRGD